MATPALRPCADPRRTSVTFAVSMPVAPAGWFGDAQALSTVRKSSNRPSFPTSGDGVPDSRVGVAPPRASVGCFQAGACRGFGRAIGSVPTPSERFSYRPWSRSCPPRHGGRPQGTQQQACTGLVWLPHRGQDRQRRRARSSLPQCARRSGTGRVNGAPFDAMRCDAARRHPRLPRVSDEQPLTRRRGAETPIGFVSGRLAPGIRGPVSPPRPGPRPSAARPS